MTKKLKYGVIGCGGIAKGKHFPALETITSMVEVVAVCDIVKERAEDAAKRFELSSDQVFTDYKELLKIEDMDAVLVLTPNISHSYISIDAMAAGKHVMCEKPMAINAEEGRKMVEASKKYGKLLTVGYNNRFRQDSLYMKDACVNGELGDIYYAKAHAVRRKAVPTWGVFLDEEKQGGGPLIDIGTHALDLTLWMLDNYEVESVTGSVFKKLGDNPDGNAFGMYNPRDMTVEDSAFGFIKMKNGTTINLESSWALNTRFKGEAMCTLHGTKAGADMWDGLWFNDAHNNKLRDTKVDTEVGSVPFFEGASTLPESLEAQTFANAILNGTPLVVTPEQALIVTEILEAIYKSAETKEAVYFE